MNYGQQISSSISVSVVEDARYPTGRSVTFKPEGAQEFSAIATFNPDASGTPSVEVNATLDFSQGNCPQLPMSYTLTVSASDGTYSETHRIPLQLLKAKWLVMLCLDADHNVRCQVSKRAADWGVVCEDHR